MSTTTTPPTTVQFGDYYGFTKSDLEDEKALYVRTRKKLSQMRHSAAGGTLAFTGINGKQLTFRMDDADAYLAQWRASLENAFAQLAGNCEPYSDRSIATFQ